MARGDFWTSTWGKIIRTIGIYAAGTIPVVGAVATQVVRVADAETFKEKTKRPPVQPAPQPAPVTQTLVPFNRDALFIPPLNGTSGSAPAGGVLGRGDFFKLPTGVPEGSGEGPTLGFYFAVGVVVIVATLLIWRR